MDKNVIKDTASRADNETEVTGDVLKRWCHTDSVLQNVTHSNTISDVSVNCQNVTPSSPLMALCEQAREHANMDLSNVTFQMTFDSSDEETVEKKISRCECLWWGWGVDWGG